MSEIQMEDRQPPVMTADNADHDTTYIGFECIPEAWSTWPDNEEHILPLLQTVQVTIQPAPSRHGVIATVDYENQSSLGQPHQHGASLSLRGFG